MDTVQLAFLMLAIGLGLIVLELFLPSAGIISVLAMASLLFACLMAWRSWAGTNNTALWLYFVGVLVAIPATVGGTLYIMPRTKFGNRILLDAPKIEDVTPGGEELVKLQELIGRKGRTVTPIRPGGMVEVAGGRYHCESEGLLIERGRDVNVLAVKGNRLVIRMIDANAVDNVTSRDEPVAERPTIEREKLPSEDVAADDLRNESESDIAPNSLDFDIPETT